MENQTFDLRNIRRYLDFPLKIETIGYRPKNKWVHRHNRITQYFLCFILKSEKLFSLTRVNGSLRKSDGLVAHMALVRPGTVMDSVEPSCKDELFFTYPPSAGEQIDNFHLQRCSFEPTPAFSDTLQRIRNCFSRLQYPGVADRLDCLAIELAQEAMIASLSWEKNPASKTIPDERIFLPFPVKGPPGHAVFPQQCIQIDRPVEMHLKIIGDQENPFIRDHFRGGILFPG